MSLREAFAKLNLDSQMPRRSPDDDMISATNTVVPYERALGRIQRVAKPTPAPPDEAAVEAAPMTVERLIADAKRIALAQFEPEPDTFIESQAFLLDETGKLTVVALPGLNGLQVVRALQKLVVADRAAAVVLINEGYFPAPTNDEERAYLNNLKLNQLLHRAPKHLIREMITVQIETAGTQLRGEGLLITVAEDGTRSLAPDWQPIDIPFSGPSYRHFFPAGH